MSLSAAILVACCTATLGLHSSSSTTSSYSYLAFPSALRSRTARSAELRPPRPLAELPPVSGPMKPTFTLSLAAAGAAANAGMSAANANAAIVLNLIIGVLLNSSQLAAPVAPHVRAVQFSRQARQGRSPLARDRCPRGAVDAERQDAVQEIAVFDAVVAGGR